MGFGRPSKYKEEYCEQLIEHMTQGYSYLSFAGKVRVCFDTLYEWEKVHTAFSEAKKIGWAQSLLFWESMGVDASIDKSNINTAIYIFSMKCKFRKQGWNDLPDLVQEKKPDENLLKDLPENND